MGGNQLKKILKESAKNKSETSLQMRCVNLANNLKEQYHVDIMCLHIKNENKEAHERIKGHSMGVLAGASDLIVFTKKDNKTDVSFIEFKKVGGVQSEVQKKFEKDVNSFGFEYHIINDYNDFAKLIANKTGIKFNY